MKTSHAILIVFFSPSWRSLLFLFLLTSISGLVFSQSVSSANYPPVVTESNLRTAILGKGSTFSSQDLITMDINDDGILDVADLIFYLKNKDLLHAVNFVSVESTVNEGDGTLALGVEYTEDYFGTLEYIVEGTAAPGSDFSPLSGSLPVDNRTEFIDLNFLDDLDLEDVETIIITLIPSMGYQIGRSQQHIIYLHDNDSIWRGNLHVENMIMGFDVVLTQSGSSFEATVQSDGSNGFPVGTWPVEVTISDDSFFMAIGPISIEADETLLLAELSRIVYLTAYSANQNHTIDFDGLIRGNMTEEIESAAMPHFNRLSNEAVFGSFTLVKSANYLPEAPSGLENLN